MSAQVRKLGVVVRRVLGIGRARRRHGAARTAARCSRDPASAPGPAILYERPKPAPQLTNAASGARGRSSSRAPAPTATASSSTRTSSTTTTARRRRPTRAIRAPAGSLFSQPNGTYTYPTAAGYAGNAADLVELRVKPLASARPPSA